MADKELGDLLRWEGYTSILDEVMEVISTLQMLKKDDLELLVGSGAIEISGEDGKVTWLKDPTFNSKYNEVKGYALAGNLYAVNNTAFIWNFPAKIFSLLEEVYILTYLFDGQLQRYFYDLHGIEYEYFSVERNSDRYKLVPRTNEADLTDRQQLKQLIHVYDGKLNDVGEKETALSKNWLMNKHNVSKVKQLKKNLYNYFRNERKTNAEDFMWTTFKDAKKKLSGKGFTREEPKSNDDTSRGKACFTSFNLRATNKYRHKIVLAFCLNRFMNPVESHFFRNNGVQVNEEFLALSDLLQWLFRSAIREGKEVHVYIPSKRMRLLLVQWLNNEI